MEVLKRRRERLGLSQRELAARAGVAFRTLQLLERGRHDARLSTLKRIAAGLGSSAAAVERALERSLGAGGDCVAEASARIAEAGESAWKPYFLDFVDAFRRAAGLSLVAEPPDERLSSRLQALFASTVERLCAERGRPAPLWCAGVRSLAEPWFVSGMESLKAAALVESPAQFRKRNIFVLGNFLDRA